MAKKYMMMLIGIAAAILVILGTVQYLMARYGAENELLTKAQRDMENSQRTAAVKTEVESAIRNINAEVEANLHDTTKLYRISSALVRNNPHIVGAGVAFIPGYHKGRANKGYFAPYAFDLNPRNSVSKASVAKVEIRTELLDFDYTDREWFTSPITDGKSLWTEPYLDKGGTHIILSTYVEAVRNAKGQIVGVFFADVPIEDVSLMSMSMYDGISRSTLISIALQVLGMMILCCVIWRAALASKHRNEEKGDEDKARLLSEIEKLRNVNRRLTERNMDLANKLKQLMETTDKQWFG